MEPLEIITARLTTIAETSIVLLPQIVVAVVIIVCCWLIARAAAALYGRAMRRSRLRPSLVDVLQKLIVVAIWTGGLMIAATVLFPNLTPARLLAGLGIGSIAMGLAFKDIFENFLAGILILLREPMRLGDHVECEGVEGLVEKITIRDTYIRRTDGQLVMVPNAMLFKNPVYIRTDRPQRRAAIICGVAYDEDVDQARQVIEAAVRGVTSVDRSQPIQVFAQSFGSSSVDFEITWWTGSQPVEQRRSRDTVVAAVKAALDDAGIEIPFPYRTLTFKGPVPIETSAANDRGDGRQ